MSSFENLRIVDNFYQTSAFFPMPTVLVSTLTPDGKHFPRFLFAHSRPIISPGANYYAMLLCARNSSNTSQHLLAKQKAVR
jgi:hypothetical protein